MAYRKPTTMAKPLYLNSPLSPLVRFSPPKGIRVFSTYGEQPYRSMPGLSRFSPPKGIRVFSTSGGDVFLPRGPKWFQSPEGDSCLFYAGIIPFPPKISRLGVLTSFQSPEGDSCLFYLPHPLRYRRGDRWLLVSVPRRGFVSFLLMSLNVSDLFQIARFQSPEGDSCLFYLDDKAEVNPVVVLNVEFQSPEGDSCLFYVSEGQQRSSKGKLVSVPRRGFVSFLPGSPAAPPTEVNCFSPPKGIRVFSTWNSSRRSTYASMFQSPEGDSCLFYHPDRCGS
jgi:hypothetical protein